MQNNRQIFFKKVKSRLGFILFLLTRLPAAWFAGVKISEINERYCSVTIRYGWSNKNPFRSVYFACLSMAAEMSSGALVMANCYNSKPAISMLVIKTEAEFYKKAKGKITFVCNDGKQIEDAVNAALSENIPVSFRSRSVGLNQEGDTVAEFFITWSLKRKE
ncbi:MAG: DUF4442 domain-containing protein [Chitinophagaceae bacterium]|nr:DUF4442 domain-containing protein [Chitinophagaceae bacterium]